MRMSRSGSLALEEALLDQEFVVLGLSCCRCYETQVC